MTYELYCHESFSAQIEDFARKFPQDKDALLTALTKSRDDPNGDGSEPLTGIETKSLQGKLRRLHVGGRRGQRYIYLVHPGLELVMAVYVSRELKANFEYDLAEIEAIANEIMADWLADRKEKFKQARR